MLINRWFRGLARANCAVALLLALTPASFAQVMLGEPCSSCSQTPCCGTTCCKPWQCPPPYKYCEEGPPCICVLCGCPKPVCCPSDAPNWGYFQTCWRPNPWGPNWSHCYGLPPAAQVVPTMPGAGASALHTMPTTPSASLPQLPTH